MWMMGYNDGGELNLPDSFNGRKLRPIVPRPGSTSLSSINNTTPCLSRIHKADLLSFNHHLGVAEQNKREVNAQQVVVSSRWNPTPEQLQTLEELYRRGTRTPSADQIQHITSQLRRYGKIEGKNVFYWFQNHKARERQKRRRQLESEFCEEQQQCRDVEITPTKDSGANRTGVGVEVEQTKGWAVPTNCTSTTLVADQKNATILRAAVKAGAADRECRRADGWVRFDEGELHQRTSLFQRNATWQMMQLSCSPPLHTSTASVITTAVTSDTVGTVNPKFLKSSQDQTLQLFPLRSSDDDDDENSGDEAEAEAEACHFAPYPFFEFLPLKN